MLKKIEENIKRIGDFTIRKTEKIRNAVNYIFVLLLIVIGTVMVICLFLWCITTYMNGIFAAAVY